MSKGFNSAKLAHAISGTLKPYARLAGRQTARAGKLHEAAAAARAVTPASKPAKTSKPAKSSGPKGLINGGSKRQMKRFDVRAPTLAALEQHNTAGRVFRAANYLDSRLARRLYKSRKALTMAIQKARYGTMSSAERTKNAKANAIHRGGLRSKTPAHPDNKIGRNAATHGFGATYSAGRERRFERMFGVRKSIADLDVAIQKARGLIQGGSRATSRLMQRHAERSMFAGEALRAQAAKEYLGTRKRLGSRIGMTSFGGRGPRLRTSAKYK